MLRPNGSREDMRVKKETDVSKLSEAVGIQLRRTGLCRLRASGDTPMLTAIEAIRRQIPRPSVKMWFEDAPTDFGSIVVTVFELTVVGADA